MESRKGRKKMTPKGDRKKENGSLFSRAPKTKGREKTSRLKKWPLDPKDRIILKEIQRNFPLTPRPYLALGKKLKLPEAEVLERVKKLKEERIIRRIGASFSSRGVGFSSTLCAASVPPPKIDKFVAAVNSFPGVTHNYEREGTYNIWFTLIASSKNEINRILNRISRQTGVKKILNLPALKTFKIAVDFNFD
jgi:DNA-binding Lrp family transcriptional regulator